MQPSVSLTRKKEKKLNLGVMYYLGKGVLRP